MKKNQSLKVEFIGNSETIDSVVSNALMTQLMVTITQIGIRVDNLDDVHDIIEKEKINNN